jgi:2-polyprenyl-6-methoxyphenol hydroxylase-like FAD-dependent oxidoreductase
MKNSSASPAGNKHAIVIGASLSGLLAANQLASHFQQVTIVERDQLPDEPVFRNGVPQARHIHVLLGRGRALLEEFFPGFDLDLQAAGAVSFDWAADCRWFNFGGWKPRFSSELIARQCSRELLEWLIRQRVRRHSNIIWSTAREVTGLVTNLERTHVTGVRLFARSGSASNSPEESGEPEADLVVNASGRDSHAGQWLSELGYLPPQESRVNSFLGYASRCYQPPEGWPADWKALVLSATPPRSSRGGVLAPLEGRRWLVTLAGAARDFPPTDEQGFMDFARSLPTPILYEAIQSATPLTSIVGYRRTENLRRHYEKLPRYLDGFISMGDAVCAFNPVYGQGMTVAALSAQALGECLREQRRRFGGGDLTGLAKRFHKRLDRIIALPWLLATGEDFRYATTEGGRPALATRLLRPYLDRLLLSANRNPAAHHAFLQVIHLTHSPAVLFRPTVVVPMLTR